MEKYEGSICPNILRKLEKAHKLSRICIPRFCGRNEFEVQEGITDRFVVDLDKHSCTCGLFQLRGYPCAHAYAAICERRQKVEDYVNSCYKKDVYLNVYSHMIHAVPGSSDYIKTSYEPLNAPNYRRKKGRPKKMRRRGVDEVDKLVSTRKGLPHHCKNCLQVGHTRITCKNATCPNSTLKKDKAADFSLNSKVNASRTTKQIDLAKRSKELKAKTKEARKRVNTRVCQTSEASKQPAEASRQLNRAPRQPPSNQASSNQASEIEQPSQGSQGKISQGLRSEDLLGKRKKSFNINISGVSEPSKKAPREKRLQISEVLENIRLRSKRLQEKKKQG